MTTTTDKFGNHRCAECSRFVSPSEYEAGKAIRHANYCDSKAQPARAAVPGRTTDPRLVSRAAHQGAISAVLSDDEIVKAVRCGDISVNDAMNRDF